MRDPGNLVHMDHISSKNNHIILVEACSSSCGLGIKDVGNVSFSVENTLVEIWLLTSVKSN